jgi:hypothetical protein
MSWYPNRVRLRLLVLEYVAFLPPPCYLLNQGQSDRRREGYSVIRDGAHLFQIMVGLFDLVPFASRPSSVFFLVSKHNFEEAWGGWLFHTLEHRGYDVSPSFRSIPRLNTDLMPFE